MSLQRRINRQRRAKPRASLQPIYYDGGINRTSSGTAPVDQRDRWGGWVGENHVDKGKEDGRCNRTACQKPLIDEIVHQFMSGNFTGGPRLFYCAQCAHEFDKWDFRSGDRVRIERELKPRFA